MADIGEIAWRAEVSACLACFGIYLAGVVYVRIET